MLLAFASADFCDLIFRLINCSVGDNTPYNLYQLLAAVTMSKSGAHTLPCCLTTEGVPTFPSFQNQTWQWLFLAQSTRLVALSFNCPFHLAEMSIRKRPCTQCIFHLDRPNNSYFTEDALAERLLKKCRLPGIWTPSWLRSHGKKARKTPRPNSGISRISLRNLMQLKRCKFLRRRIPI